MAIALEIGIGNLFPEFFADALVFFGPLQTAGAVAAGTLQTVLDHLNHFLVIIQTYSHGGFTSFRIHYTIGEQIVKAGRKEKRDHPKMISFWWARRDLNPHVRNEH